MARYPRPTSVLATDKPSNQPTNQPINQPGRLLEAIAMTFSTIILASLTVLGAVAAIPAAHIPRIVRSISRCM
jgi:hypothetical protein